MHRFNHILRMRELHARIHPRAHDSYLTAGSGTDRQHVSGVFGLQLGKPAWLLAEEIAKHSVIRGATARILGLTLILEERGIPNTQKPKLVCPSADSNNAGRLPGATDCCARRTMMHQPDIRAQKSIIQAQAQAEGCLVIYPRKYHCELNPIKQCWGAAKRVYRDSPPSSSEADIKRNMLKALDSVSLESIRRFAARSQRFVHAYSHGLTGSQAAWAAKKYRGHRIIPDTLLKEMGKED